MSRFSCSTRTTSSARRPIRPIPTNGSPSPTPTCWGCSRRCGGNFSAKGSTMKKQILLVLAVAAAGCWGSDPNMNSQVFQGQAGSTGTGTGGSTGAGGTSNPNGAIVGSALALFNTGADGFVFGTYDEPANLNGASSANKGTLSFDSAVGNPDPGSLKVL